MVWYVSQQHIVALCDGFLSRIVSPYNESHK